jgi:hypothetical protein
MKKVPAKRKETKRDRDWFMANVIYNSAMEEFAHAEMKMVEARRAYTLAHRKAFGFAVPGDAEFNTAEFTLAK